MKCVDQTLHLRRPEVVGFAHDEHQCGSRIVFRILPLEDARLFVSFAVVGSTCSVVGLNPLLLWPESDPNLALA